MREGCRGRRGHVLEPCAQDLLNLSRSLALLGAGAAPEQDRGDQTAGTPQAVHKQHHLSSRIGLLKSQRHATGKPALVTAKPALALLKPQRHAQVKLSLVTAKPALVPQAQVWGGLQQSCLPLACNVPCSKSNGEQRRRSNTMQHQCSCVAAGPGVVIEECSHFSPACVPTQVEDPWNQLTHKGEHNAHKHV